MLDRMSAEGTRSLTRHLFCRMSGVIVVHSLFAQEVLAAAEPECASRIRKVTYIDRDFVYAFPGDQAQARSALGLKAGDRTQVILFFGQIKETKGLGVLLEAFRQIEAGRDVLLLVAGKPWHTDVERYTAQIAEWGIGGKVEWRTQYIRNEDVPAYFAAATVVVLPYLKIYNSGVLLRAMNYGTPVVCSDLPAFLEVVEPGRSALVFQAGNAAALAATLRGALDVPASRDAVRAGAHERIAQGHSRPAIGAAMDKIYRDMLAGAAP
jgi:D-inositol-3-phosphate glycosyltransferase